MRARLVERPTKEPVSYPRGMRYLFVFVESDSDLNEACRETLRSNGFARNILLNLKRVGPIRHTIFPLIVCKTDTHTVTYPICE